MAGKASENGLVTHAADKMRAAVLAQAPETPIGALPDIARALGIGVVTVRQAARVLEHEGYLKVRRGNGGGFFGTRPDVATLGRAVAGFLRMGRSHEREAIEITTLLDCDLIAAAALSTDETLRAQLREQAEQIDACDTPDQRAVFVEKMHDILFKMVDRPLTEMLSRMAMQHYATHSEAPIYHGPEGVAQWKEQRRNMVEAILRRDGDLARFEAQRRRTYVLEQVSPRPPS